MSKASDLISFVKKRIEILIDSFTFEPDEYQSVIINPIQYNPISKVLRIYNRIVVEINESKNKLNKEYLDNATPAQLHEFHFINENNISSIPKEYNCLVGHYDCENAKALHYTNGGPWFDEYKYSEHANEWWKVYNSL